MTITKTDARCRSLASRQLGKQPPSFGRRIELSERWAAPLARPPKGVGYRKPMGFLSPTAARCGDRPRAACCPGLASLDLGNMLAYLQGQATLTTGQGRLRRCPSYFT